MLTHNQRRFLFRALHSNSCLLFVGAGFSTDARNRLGSGIPAGPQLAAQLWTRGPVLWCEPCYFRLGCIDGTAAFSDAMPRLGESAS